MKKNCNGSFWKSLCLFAGTGMTVAAMFLLPVAITSDKSLVRITLYFFLIGIVFYIFGVLYALNEDDCLLKKRAKEGGIVMLIGAVSMAVSSVLFYVMGRELSGSAFLIAEWASFVVSCMLTAMLLCCKV